MRKPEQKNDLRLGISHLCFRPRHFSVRDPVAHALQGWVRGFPSGDFQESPEKLEGSLRRKVTATRRVVGIGCPLLGPQAQTEKPHVPES